jgi:hypothetical protein
MYVFFLADNRAKTLITPFLLNYRLAFLGLCYMLLKVIKMKPTTTFTGADLMTGITITKGLFSR